ncbi:MAG: hypothetical protein AAFO77_06035 [Pseudomonadota bacterium]
MTLLNFFSIGGVGLMQFVTGPLVTTLDKRGDAVATYTGLMWFYVAVFALALGVYLFSRDAPPKAGIIGT